MGGRGEGRGWEREREEVGGVGGHFVAPFINDYRTYLKLFARRAGLEGSLHWSTCGETAGCVLFTDFLLNRVKDKLKYKEMKRCVIFPRCSRAACLCMRQLTRHRAQPMRCRGPRIDAGHRNVGQGEAGTSCRGGRDVHPSPDSGQLSAK